MLALFTGLGLIAIAIFLALIPIPIMFWAFINCIRNPQLSGGKKFLWAMAILFIYPFAYSAYPFVYDNERKLRKAVKIVSLSWIGMIVILGCAKFLLPAKNPAAGQEIAMPCCLNKSETTAEAGAGATADTAATATEQTPPPNTKKLNANELYQKCIQKDAASCTSLGEAYKDGQGVKMDSKNATYYFTQACTLGDGHGCGLHGEYMLPPWGTASYKEVGDVFLKGCQAKDDQSCVNLVAMVTGGSVGITNYKDDVDSSSLQPETWLAQVQEILVAKCDAKVATACGALGRLVAKGAGAKPDLVKALPLLEKACDSEIWDACGLASKIYISGGEGVPKNMSKGMALASKSLDGSMKAFKAAQDRTQKK